jgi:hypothetical protein
MSNRCFYWLCFAGLFLWNYLLEYELLLSKVESETHPTGKAVLHLRGLVEFAFAIVAKAITLQAGKVRIRRLGSRTSMPHVHRCLATNAVDRIVASVDDGRLRFLAPTHREGDGRRYLDFFDSTRWVALKCRLLRK